MVFLPFENITYLSDLTESEVYSRLRNAVEPRSYRNYTKPYSGEVNDASFKIQRVIDYRNSFLPRIIGTIQANQSGTEVNVRMGLHPGVLVFLFLWCSFATVLFVIFVMNSIGNAGFFPFIPILFLLFGYAISTIGFQYESRKSIEELRKIFVAEIKK